MKSLESDLHIIKILEAAEELREINSMSILVEIKTLDNEELVSMWVHAPIATSADVHIVQPFDEWCLSHAYVRFVLKDLELVGPFRVDFFPNL